MIRSRHLIIALVIVAFGLAPAGCGSSSSKDKSANTKSADQASSDIGGATATGDATQQDAAAKSNARNVATVMEACYTDSQSYDSCKTQDQLNGAGLQGVTVGSAPGQTEVSAAAASTYTVTAHSQSGNTFTIEKAADGSSKRSCEAKVEGGGCQNGSW
jgi:hypothetical protein